MNLKEIKMTKNMFHRFRLTEVGNRIFCSVVVQDTVDRILLTNQFGSEKDFQLRNGVISFWR